MNQASKFPIIYLAIGLIFSAASAAETSQAPLKRFQVGEVLITGTALRDAFMVARVVRGLTDNHAYADRTVLDGVTDAGTYGAFDSTVELRGSNEQNHLFSFQDRAKYSGSNALLDMGGLLSRPVHAGTGEIKFRTGVDIRDIQVTKGGKVGHNIGIYIRDQKVGSDNSALTITQSTGRTINSTGSAPSYHRSNIVFGSGSGPVIASDSAQAIDVRDLSSSERAVAARLRPLIKASRLKGEGASGKIHVGISARDVAEAFKAEGLNAYDYAILNMEGSSLGVRYDELLAFVLSSI